MRNWISFGLLPDTELTHQGYVETTLFTGLSHCGLFDCMTLFDSTCW